MIDSIKKHTKNGFFHIFTGNILIKAISFISSFLIVRLVTKEEYASFSYAENIYGYINLLAGLGLGAALIKVVAENENIEIRKAYTSFSLKIGLIFQLFLIICIIIFSNMIELPFKQTKIMLLGLCLVPILDFILQIVQGYNRGTEKNKEFAKIGIIQSVVLTFFTIGLVFYFGVFGTIIAKYIAYSTAILYGVYLLKTEFEGTKKVILSYIEKKYIIQVSISLMLANLFSSMMPINETFLINNLIQDVNASANFRVASLLPSQLIIVTNSLVIYYFPIIAKEKQLNKLKNNIRQLFFYNFLLISVISIIGIIFTPFIIKYVYGTAYSDAMTISNMLWIVRAINTMIRVVPMNILPAIDGARFNAIFSFVSTLIHLVLDYIFIKNMGINGVAYASIIVYIISGIGYWIYIIKFLKKGE